MKKTDYDNQSAEHQRVKFLSDDFKIVAINQTAMSSPKSFHEEIEIKYYYETGAKILIGSDIIETEKGDIVIINPYEFHANVLLNNERIRYYSFVISLDYLSSYKEIDLRNILIEKGIKFINVIRGDGRLQTILQRVFEEIEGEGEHYRLIVRGLIAEFFALLLRSYVSGDKSREDNINLKQAEVVLPALNKIHADYKDKITAEELASLCNISKYYFCRVFKEVMGTTPIEYIINYRLRVAEIMLKENKESIATIASLCGFEDESYFCRSYKKRKGISPQKNRKNLK